LIILLKKWRFRLRLNCVVPLRVNLVLVLMKEANSTNYQVSIIKKKA
jgi:hypothetical protein